MECYGLEKNICFRPHCVGVIEKHKDAALFYLIHGAFQVRMIEHTFCYQLSFSALTYGVLPFSPSWFAAGIIDFRP
jgi:hypothetical protein